MMNKVRLIGLFLCLTCVVYGGERKSKETLFGDKYYSIGDYYLASEYYEEALAKDPTDPYLVFQLAECERHFFEYEKAEVMYGKVVQAAGSQYPLALYQYATMKKLNGKYLEAKENYEEFLEKYSDNEEVDQEYLSLTEKHIEGCEFALNELRKPIRNYEFNVLPRPVNSAESDFAPAFYLNDTMIVLSSARFVETDQEIDGRLGGTFLDNYVFSLNSAGVWTKSSFSDGLEMLNSRFHEGAGTFTHDHLKFYFTRCDIELKRGEGYTCAIYASERENGQWSTPKKLNSNINQKYEYNAQPSLSTNEDTLFFVSKRPGGKGMSDIWYSVKGEGDDDWGPAVNLEEVNTPFLDMAPDYNDEEKALFFSSNGHMGFGGLDIYSAPVKNFSNVTNLGLPFSSNKDDFYFILGENKGYLASNRSGGVGHDDIYIFNSHSDIALLARLRLDTLNDVNMATIEGVLGDASVVDVSDLFVVLKDFEGNIVAETLTDENGKFVFNDVKADKPYNMFLNEKTTVAREKDYTLDSLNIIYQSNQPIATIDDDTKSISISGQLLDKKGDPWAGQEIVLLDKASGRELKTTTTDENGEFTFSNLPADREYRVMVRDKDGNLKEYDYQSKKVQVKQHKENENTTSLDLAASNQGQSSRVHFEDVYFDFDSDKLRGASKSTLNKLVEFVKPHDHLKIEIKGNTDSVGTKAYNYALGNRRGQSAYDYLVKKGLDKSDLVVVSIGEDNPVAPNSSEEGRQLNRRVEFYVVGGGEYDPEAMVYVVPPKTTLDQVAQQFDMSTEEIKEINNLESDSIAAYQPLRLRRTDDSDVLDASQPRVTIETRVESSGSGGEETVRTSDSTVSRRITDRVDVKKEVKEGSEINGIYYSADDGSGYYTVLPNNTLYGIAKLFETSESQIMRWNEMKDKTIYMGQRLRVKQQVKTEETEREEMMLIEAGVKPKEHLGETIVVGGKKRYVVQHGDTFYDLAERFGFTLQEFKELNQLDSYVLYSGMILKVEK